MDHSVPTVATLLLAASLSAQNVSATFESGGSALYAAAGPQAQALQIPTGPLGPIGGLSASAGIVPNQATASFGWSSFRSETRLELDLSASCNVAGAASAGLAPLDVVVMLSHPTTINVSLDATAFHFGPTASLSPVMRIDVLDDGSFELDESTPQTLSTFVQIGPTPVPIRCQLAIELDAQGAAVANLALALRPADTYVDTLFGGCATAPFWVMPRFDGSLEYGTDNVFAGSMFAVFGLQTQPVYLGNYAWPNSSVVLPCVLIPTADLVTYLSPTSFQHVLQIPAAARPITLYSQGVWLAPGALTATDASRIVAY